MSNKQFNLPIFFWINKRDKSALKRAAKTATQSAQSRNTSPLPSQNKQLSNTEEQEKPHPQLEPTQSMKPTKVKLQPSVVNNFVNQRKKTKKLLSLWIDSTSSSNAILFLAFQIVQKIHKGSALQTSFLFFPTNGPSQSKSFALTMADSTHCTPKKRKTTLIKSLSWHNGGGCDLSIFHAFGKVSIYSLKVKLV